MSRLTYRGELGFAVQPISSVSPFHGQWLEWLVRPSTLEPEQFVDAVQSMGETLILDRLVLVQALSWLEHQQPATRLSINVFADSISHPEFCDFVQNQLREYRIGPQQVCFEVTEHHAITNIGFAESFCRRMRSMGAHVALDDVGKGNLHIELLEPLRMVDFIKIDRDWTIPAPNSPAHKKTVRELATLGRQLGIDVVLEGVETPAHLDLVHELGVGFYQGYINGLPIQANTQKTEGLDFRRWAASA